MSDLVSRNVMIRERRTSVRLEREIWAAIDDICRREHLTLHQFCGKVEEARRVTSRTSAIRSATVSYLRLLAASQRSVLPYTKAGESTGRRGRGADTRGSKHRAARDSSFLRRSLEGIAKTSV